MILFSLFAVASLCIPMAYKMGRLTGSEDMKRCILSHPSVRGMGVRNQIEEIDLIT